MSDFDRSSCWNMLDELLADDSDTMDAWETEFVESLEKQRQSQRFEINDKQWISLCRIWKRVFE